MQTCILFCWCLIHHLIYQNQQAKTPDETLNCIPLHKLGKNFSSQVFLHIRWLKQKSTSTDFVNSYSLSHFGIFQLFLGCPTTKRVRVDRTFQLRHTFQKKCVPSVHFSIRLEYHEKNVTCSLYRHAKDTYLAQIYFTLTTSSVVVNIWHTSYATLQSMKIQLMALPDVLFNTLFN